MELIAYQYRTGCRYLKTPYLKTPTEIKISLNVPYEKFGYTESLKRESRLRSEAELSIGSSYANGMRREDVSPSHFS